MLPKISIILCTYNRDSFLPTMLDSIKNQDYQNYELILINDNSSDSTESIIESYLASDNRIVYYKNIENKKLPFSRQLAIDMAKGQYITFVDDDDYLEKNYLSFLLNLIENNDSDIAICARVDVMSQETVTVSEVKLQNFDRLESIKNLLIRKPYNANLLAKLFKRDLFKDVRIPIGVLIDDIHISYKLYEKSKKVSYANAPLYYRIIHETNISSFTRNKNEWTPELLREYIDFYLVREKYLLEKAPEIKSEIEFSTFDFMRNIYSTISTNEKDFEKEIDFIKKTLSTRKLK